MLKNIPYIDEFVILDHEIFLKASYFKKFRELFLAWKVLAFKRFLLVLNLHKDKKYRLLTLFTQKKEHSYFSSRDPFPLTGHFHTYDYLSLCKTHLQPKSNTMFIFSKEKASKIEFDVALSPGGDVNDCEKMNRTWPLEYYIQLCKLLRKKGYRVLIVGDKSHRFFEENFVRCGAVSKIGKTDLEQLAKLLCKVNVLVTHDGGVFHLGRLVGCKRIGIFGPTNFKNFVDPLDSNEKVIVSKKKLSCMPCYDGKRYAQCSHKKCMFSIQPSDIMSLIDRSMF